MILRQTLSNNCIIHFIRHFELINEKVDLNKIIENVGKQQKDE